VFSPSSPFRGQKFCTGEIIGLCVLLPGASSLSLFLSFHSRSRVIYSGRRASESPSVLFLPFLRAAKRTINVHLCRYGSVRPLLPAEIPDQPFLSRSAPGKTIARYRGHISSSTRVSPRHVRDLESSRGGGRLVGIRVPTCRLMDRRAKGEGGASDRRVCPRGPRRASRRPGPWAPS